MSMKLERQIQTTIEQSEMDRHKYSPLSYVIETNKSGSDLFVHKTVQRSARNHVRMHLSVVGFTY
jgi:hypothetical protein